MTAKVELLTPSGGKVILDPTNTAVDRVLTLPAVAGTVFNQGNVVGTVSQSSGVPTGSIIERGSNANGEFVRFADGTLICLKNFEFSFSGSSSSNGVINWPSAFVNTDYSVAYGSFSTVHGNPDAQIRAIFRAQSTDGGNKTTNSAKVQAITNLVGTYNTRAEFTAIGRWA